MVLFFFGANAPIKPLAVLNKFIGFEPSVIKVDCRPRAWSIFNWWSGPDVAISFKVWAPIAPTICSNLRTSISEFLFALSNSIILRALVYSSSEFLAWVSLSNSESASILAACAFSLACSTAASPSILKASALDWASALAWPVDSTAALKACNSSKALLACSALASSKIRCLSNLPLASCSNLSASCLAAASCEFVVISIANWTDFCKESLVLWSTGSTPFISMLVT